MLTLRARATSYDLQWIDTLDEIFSLDAVDGGLAELCFRVDNRPSRQS
jgi:hypothetical protein